MIKVSKLSFFAIGLGFVGILASIIIVFTTYNNSIRTTEKRFLEFYNERAQLIHAIVETNKYKSEEEILDLISHIYMEDNNRPLDEYICIVDGNADLILHTMNPTSVGNYAGRNEIFTDNNLINTLKDLVVNKENFLGHYISSNGQDQIAAFNYVHSRNWTVGVHRSKEVLLNEVKLQYRWFLIAFILISGLLLPLSLILLFWNTKNAHKRQLVYKIVSEENLKKQNELLNREKLRAEESDRLKTAFLANMSHEIRTPMNGILGFVNLLKEPNLNGKNQARYIEIIERSGERMLSTINDIIDISKIESNQMELLITEVNVNEQLQEIYNFFKLEADNKKLELICKTDLSNDLSNIKTDREKLYAIISNLLKNAIKYTDSGKIEFGYNRVGENLEFYFIDTGIGIERVRQKAVFERFVQADIEDVNAKEGSGLGLSITKEFVEMLQGSIRLESDLNIGSKIYFTIPYNVVRHPKSERINIDSNEIHQHQDNKYKILIAEDDNISQLHLEIILSDINSELLIAKDGNTAVSICKETPDIDIVLMDIKMPGLDGIKATQQIREFNKEIQIIAQSAYTFDGDKEEARRAGCNGYITKPIDKNQLISLINELLEK